MISPSILAADFTQLGDECKMVLQAGADMLHFDVMDGNFVPNISVGLPVLEALHNKIDAVYDVHLMIERPERYINAFAKAGADILTVHIEACNDVKKTLADIRGNGMKAALSLKPGTPVESVFPYLAFLDMVLVMSVEPGFGGQAFMPSALDRLAAIKAEIIKQGLAVDLQVDGGINIQTAALCVKAGANILVAGNAVFRAKCPKDVICELRS